LTEFAAGYERNEDGWILFPRDVEWRRKLFPQGVFDHPAKANMFLIQELVRYLTKPGDTIIDPFGGTGTLMLALLEDRNVVLVDIESHYVALMREAQGSEHFAGTASRLFIYEGDCRQRLQELDFLCDAAIFSPPYSTALSHSTAIKEQKEVLTQYALEGSSTQNLARLNPFYFTHALGLVYERLCRRLTPGAPVAIITKDIMKGPRRTFLSEGIIRQAQKNSLTLTEWHKWKPPGSMQQSIMKAKGAYVVLDEDILIFRKEE